MEKNKTIFQRKTSKRDGRDQKNEGKKKAGAKEEAKEGKYTQLYREVI